MLEKMLQPYISLTFTVCRKYMVLYIILIRVLTSIVEVKMFLDARYVSAPEAVRRLF